MTRLHSEACVRNRQPILDALTEIFDKGEIQERQKEAFFIPNFLPSDEAREHLEQKRDTYEKVIEEISTES